MRLIVKA